MSLLALMTLFLSSDVYAPHTHTHTHTHALMVVWSVGYLVLVIHIAPRELINLLTGWLAG